MKCIFCGLAQAKASNTRTIKKKNTVKRRRICPHCGARFTTYEEIRKQ